MPFRDSFISQNFPQSDAIWTWNPENDFRADEDDATEIGADWDDEDEAPRNSVRPRSPERSNTGGSDNLGNTQEQGDSEERDEAGSMPELVDRPDEDDSGQAHESRWGRTFITSSQLRIVGQTNTNNMNGYPHYNSIHEDGHEHEYESNETIGDQVDLEYLSAVSNYIGHFRWDAHAGHLSSVSALLCQGSSGGYESSTRLPCDCYCRELLRSAR
ncbi:hypothetical protein BCR39DRAFT_559612 [Naematelia encephala]|uniref:Uncharacterized protein n=1 Tax=Naematelia encephala TaxID=71784 RepID=A0A1Y2B0I7_9TREE|nr:hypothetical protein BCR39DRAFT_559612 [Naematelia encephala]